jgi:hypothetical protein
MKKWPHVVWVLKRCESTSYPMLPDGPKIIAFWEVPRLRPFVFLITATCRWRWVWSIGGTILTGETEVLGEKHYTALVVDVWMSMEHWWNDTYKGNRSAGIKTCPSAILSVTNLTWTGQGSNPGLRGERLATNRLSHVTAWVALIDGTCIYICILWSVMCSCVWNSCWFRSYSCFIMV